MGMIINIAEALRNRAEYNILGEPLNKMLKDRQEAFEKSNPIDLLFTRGKLSTFQETYVDTIGFKNAFVETSDYGVAPIFNTHEGFSKTYQSRTFQGGFMITQQVLEDKRWGSVNDTASKFMTRWHGDTVEYAMKAISAGFGKSDVFGDEANGGTSTLKLTSADTTDGDVNSTEKSPLFSAFHNVVKRKSMSVADVIAGAQSNLFAVKAGTSTYGINLAGDDMGKIVKLADIINQVITKMENYKDDNGKYAGVQGEKTIVAPNEPRLLAALNAAVATDIFEGGNLNQAYKRATVVATPYLMDLSCCYDATNGGVGFFIVDKEYNAANHGPEFTERIALTLNVDNMKNPYGIGYDARQRFDVNVASWRGIAFVYIGSSTPSFVSGRKLGSNGAVSDATGWAGMTALTPIATPVYSTRTVS